MVGTFLVFKFNVKAVFNAHFHLDGLVRFWRGTQELYPHVGLFGNGWQEFAFNQNLHKVSNADVATSIALVLLVHILEVEGYFHVGLIDRPRRRKLLGERDEIVVWSTFVHPVTHIDPSNELNLDSQMVCLFAGRQRQHNLATDILRGFIGTESGCTKFVHRGIDSVATDTPKGILPQLPTRSMVHGHDLIIPDRSDNDRLFHLLLLLLLLWFSGIVQDDIHL
mmetsp:Transcript_30255/g.50005  ORF Transcript_30255/g.50005 Transcript_30255/m.50005 type:complete len:223 (-) Transcript_30255:164-832(-)